MPSHYIKLLVVCFIAWTAGSTAALATSESPSIDHTRALLEKGDIRAAIIQLKQAIRQDPTNAEVRYELGMVEFRLGDIANAERDLKAARDNKYPISKINPPLAITLLVQAKYKELLYTVSPCPDDAQCRAYVLAAHARANLAIKEVDSADADSKAAIEAAPTSVTAQLARAVVLMEKNDPAAAEPIVDRVLATDSRSSETITLKGDLQGKSADMNGNDDVDKYYAPEERRVQGYIEAQESYLDWAFTPNYYRAEALVLKGDIRSRAKDFSGAINYFKSALEIRPQDIAVRQRLAFALANLGQAADVQTEIDKVLEDDPRAAGALYLKALLQVREGKTVEALNTIGPVETVILDVPRGSFLLALIHAANNQLQQALSYASTFHNAEPDNIAGIKLLARIYLRSNMSNKAIAILAPLEERIGDDKETLQLLGAAYMAEGRVQEATDMLRKIEKLQPGDLLTQVQRSVNETLDPSTRDASLHELDSLAKANPLNSQIDVALLFSYLAALDFNHAIETATKMMAMQPHSPLPPTIRGAIYLAMTNETAAKADLDLALATDRTFVPAVRYLSELAMRDNDFAQARKLIDNLLQQNPMDISNLMMRADIEARANQPEAMAPFLRTAISADPKAIQPRIGLMQLMARLGHFPEAERAANDLLAIQPQTPAVVNAAAETLLAIGKTDAGIGVYQRLQSDFPNMPQVHRWLAHALMVNGQAEEARTALGRAIQADRGYLPAWSDLVMLEFRLRGLEAAEDIAEKAMIQNPRNDAARVLTGNLLVAAGRLPEAEAAFSTVLNQTPSTLAVLSLYRVLVQRGDRTKAKELLVDWLSRHNTDEDSRNALAEMLLFDRDYKGAASQYEMLARKLERNPFVLNNLAGIYDRLDDPRAFDIARRANAILPTSPEILDTYGYLLYRKGDATLGAKLERRAYSLAPNNPQIAFHMAKILSDMKDFAGARQALKPIIEANIKFSDAEQAHQLYDKISTP